MNDEKDQMRPSNGAGRAEVVEDLVADGVEEWVVVQSWVISVFHSIYDF